MGCSRARHAGSLSDNPSWLQFKSTIFKRVLRGRIESRGSIEPVFTAATLVEIVVEKGAAHVLMPISARKQLKELPDDVLTKLMLFYYSDPRDALIKGLAD